MNEKQTLRRQLIAARKTHHAAHSDSAACGLVAQTGALSEVFLGQSQIQIACYLPMGSEINLRPLMAELAKAGHDLCLPVCISKDAPVLFRRYHIGDALQPDAMGIDAPIDDGADGGVIPQLVFVPLLGFDDAGMRLGRGGGYYDRTLADLRRRGTVMACGIAYDMQMVDKCPSAPHDQALNAVLTETVLHRFERG